MKDYLPKDFSFGPYAQFFSFITIFSPIPLFLEVIRTGNTSKLPSYAFPSAVIMQLGWFIYANLINNDALFRATIISGSSLFIYATLALFFKLQWARLLFFYVLLGVLAVIFLNTPSNILGTVCSAVQILSSSMNLELIIKAFRERNGNYFNLGTLAMSFPAAFVWFCFGMELNDKSVMAPPCYDLILLSLQLLSTVIFEKKSPNEKKID